ncbi:MAG: hypothetical protein FVQ79_00015 [Planctomycetes bacterium]|nr:hypothetical protein [Planctomycetota bacterium]
MLELIGTLAKTALSPLLNLIPDKNARAAAEEAAVSQMQEGLVAIVQGQLKINMKEAEHASIFVAGWRPAIGWICGAGLGWNFIIQPIFMWLIFVFGVEIEGAPRLEIAGLITLLGGMLGLGGLRTYEKRLGVARGGIGKKSS